MLLFCALQQETSSTVRSTDPKRIEYLIQRIGENDRNALEELYRSTARAVYSFALSILKTSSDAQDIMQDTFLKIRMAAHLYQPMGKPMAWIFTICRNLARTKQIKNQGELSEESCMLENNSEYCYICDPSDRMVLESAFRILDQQEREIVLLHCVAGLKHREIAENFEKPLASVLSRYHRALKKLQKYLNQQGMS